MASAIPVIIDALVAQLPSYLPAGVNAYDGYSTSSDPDSVGSLFVGYGGGEDMDATALIGGDSTQTAGPMTNSRPRTQMGSITSSAVGWTGDDNQKTARDIAYSIIAAVESLLRASPSLGIGPEGYNVITMGDERLSQFPTDMGGRGVLIVFTVNFTARI